MTKRYIKEILICVVLFTALVSVSCGMNSNRTQLASSENDSSVALPQPVERGTPASRGQWQVASFRGLKMGSARLTDLTRMLGEPRETSQSRDNDGKEWGSYHFRISNPFVATLVAYVNLRSELIQNLELRPDSLSRAAVVELYGDEFVVTRYSFDLCLGDFDSAPLYEDSTGTIEVTEYRAKGIAVSFYEGSDNVHYVSYVSEPVGSLTSRCRQEKKP